MSAFVQQVIDGRSTLPSGMVMKTPWGQQVAQAVAQADPTYEAGKAPARNAVQADFYKGKMADTITNGRAAIQHAADLGDALEGIGNFNTGLWGNKQLNGLKNWLQDSAGNDTSVPLNQFNSIRGLMAREMTKFYAGSGAGTEAEVNRDLSVLDPNMTKSQLRGAIEALTTAMSGKIDALQTRWHAGMGPNVPDFPIIDEKTQAALDRIAGRPSGNNQMLPTTLTKPAQAAPTAAPSDPLAAARDAIARGAPRDAVIQRLKQNGIDPGGL
jgi:hypothetical protein